MKTIRLYILFIIIIFSYKILNGETIYLNDGQVILGSIITEDRETVTIKNRFQTRKIYRSHILRIMYGEQDMEEVYILLKSGELLKGYLVDQDASRVIYRESRESAVEKTIFKETIRQMSREEIYPLYPDIAYGMGLFYPINSGSAGLKAAPIFFIGCGFNLIFAKNIRALFEVGYAKSESRINDNRYFQFIPVTVNALYSITLNPFVIIPKGGFGMAITKFNSGEGDKYQGLNLDIVAGIGIYYGIIKKKLNVSLMFDYNLIFEEKVFMGNAIIRTGISYIF